MYALQIYRQLEKLARSQTHPKDASLSMYYTVAYDWRRDFWQETPRVMRALQNVYKKTGCRALTVGHSFGGRLLYTTLARHGKEAADLMGSVFYAASPFQGGATQVAGALSSDAVFDIAGCALLAASAAASVADRWWHANSGAPMWSQHICCSTALTAIPVLDSVWLRRCMPICLTRGR